ncbi:alpha/beta fold hydrolase [Thermocoleostomius sinensis]|uniref:Alpha/beta hydrolase n=1 Tax=Thermocoleostomius sinensis A174 TaxID=2016057 RepID=A0A9E8ZBU1_9CYAN|nr:alpha/beta hydrolase [Thermocoleostomius sinensis]WAL60268.1 alpha/beta hydrolase [Thermocoleostomius sinensis A174]
MASITPDFLLFVQHGWADDNRAMIALAHQLVDASTRIIAPNLGYIQTWIRIAPFIQTVETIAQDNLAQYPEVPFKIIGHSMGGLIWLEVLHRHPEWWPKVHSLVLIASPVGGADLGRMIDPFNLGIGIARDLGKDRKSIAEVIAAAIPTLVIAGDYDQGSDGTVPIACTQFSHARFICLTDLSHPALRNHPLVVSTIRDFWEDFNICTSLRLHDIIQRIRAIPGITDGHWRGFQQAKPMITLPDGSTIRVWKNWAGIDHIFVAAADEQCLYAGFVGWLHSPDLQQALRDIQKEYAE